MEVFIFFCRKVMGECLSNFVAMAQIPAAFLSYAQRLNPRDWPFYSETLRE